MEGLNGNLKRLKMLYEKILKEAISIEGAIEKIKLNQSSSFVWFPVKNNKNCYFEIGGRNKVELELKAYIPAYINGSVEIHENGFFKSEYSIDLNNIEFPTYRVSHDLNYEGFIRFLKIKDFRKYMPRVKSIERTHYTYDYELVKL